VKTLGIIYRVAAILLGTNILETCDDGDKHNWITLGYIDGWQIEECTKCNRMRRVLSTEAGDVKNKIYKKERENYKRLVKENNEKEKQKEIEMGEW
jgi:molybdenum cofactor biosynthesis enzyme MoaA